MDKEVLKLRVKNLISLRTSLINILIVLIGGVVSLFFFPNSRFTLIFGLVGGFYILVFLSNLLNLNNKLDKLLIDEMED